MTTRDGCRLLVFVAGSLLVIGGCKSDTVQSSNGGAGGKGSGGSGSGGSGSGGSGSGGSGSGGSESGGSSGTGGSSPVATCVEASDDGLIANFEKDCSLNGVDGRSGGFYVYGDSNGTFDPENTGDNAYFDSSTGNETCTGPGSFHFKATGFSQWGAAAAADFVPKAGTFKGTYDASKYKGVSFWAKATAALTGVLVSFPDIYSDGAVDPAALAALDSTIIQACVYNSLAYNNCSPYLVKFGDAQFPLYKDYQIGTDWKRFDVLFADTLQDKYNAGYHTDANVIDLQHLTGMAIQVNASYDASGTASANDFELWIDDVNFIPAEGATSGSGGTGGSSAVGGSGGTAGKSGAGGATSGSGGSVQSGGAGGSSGVGGSVGTGGASGLGGTTGSGGTGGKGGTGGATGGST